MAGRLRSRAADGPGVGWRGYARYLADTERAVLEVRRHMASLLRPFFVTVGVVIAASLAGALISPDAGGDAVDAVVSVLAIAFVVRFGWSVLEWWEDRVVVTDHRIFEISGVFTRRVASMPLIKVTDMTYRRTLAGRMFGYGDLIVESAGQRQALDRIEYLPDPDVFYRAVTSLVAARGARDAPSRPHPVVARAADDDDTGPLPRITPEP